MSKNRVNQPPCLHGFASFKETAMMAGTYREGRSHENRFDDHGMIFAHCNLYISCDTRIATIRVDRNRKPKGY